MKHIVMIKNRLLKLSKMMKNTGSCNRILTLKEKNIIIYVNKRTSRRQRLYKFT